MLTRLSAGEMPPDDQDQPTAEQKSLIQHWLDAQFSRPVPLAEQDPGRMTVHRLNRAEYNNTIRDLVGVDFKPADDFPTDDVGYGFDNIGDVLSVSPILLEKYLRAAQRIVEQALVIPPPAPPAKIAILRAAIESPAGRGPHQAGRRPAGIARRSDGGLARTAHWGIRDSFAGVGRFD